MRKYALGFDIGSGSIGWAAVEVNEQGEALRLMDWGSRIFSTSRDAKTNDPEAAKRRAARGIRRRFDRIKQRRRALIKQLVKCGLMPADEAVRKKLETLDPIKLRADAVTKKLELYEIGRALFHLQQRRGYKSNRKEGDNKEAGVIETGGGELKALLRAGNITLGQFLYQQAKEGKGARFRKQPDGGYSYYPMRDIVEVEFEAIWLKQAAHYPQLTDDAKKAIHRAIFHQRPLKPQPRGMCLLKEDEERLPTAMPSAQRVRILQKIHDIRITGGVHGYSGRSLTAEEKRKLYLALLSKGSMNEGSVRKQLKVADDESINLFRAGLNTKLLGDETAAEMRREERYGKTWDTLSLEQQDRIVWLLADCEKVTTPNGNARLLDDEEIIARLVDECGCTEEQAHNLLKAKLNANMMSFGRTVIGQLIPLMEQGYSQVEAIKKLGYHHSRFYTGEVMNELPYYGEVLGAHCIKMPSGDENVVKFGRVSNPTVHVTLNQLRKITNGLVKRFGGRPQSITIEMVRELKKGQKEIAEIVRDIKKNEKKREEYTKKIEDLGLAASDLYLAKMKLWEELAAEGGADKRVCVFTGKPISISQLLSEAIEIEHILPQSLTLDDTAANKTVTFKSFNQLKGNKAPEQLFAQQVKWEGKTITYEEVQGRAAQLKASKAWRFMPGALDTFDKKALTLLTKSSLGEVDTELSGFAARHLVDTSYTAKLAKKYLAYICDKGERGVRATPGTLTGMLRKAWGLNTLISEANEKDRSDHRHHAVDALVIALTTPSMVKRIADASKKAEQSGSKLTKAVGEIVNPWKDYDWAELKEKCDAIVVSHKPDHGSPGQKGKTTGQLHEDTYYGLTNEAASKKDSAVYVVRKAPEFFESIDKIEQIRDRRLRDEILRAVQGLSTKEEIKQTAIAFCIKREIRGIRVLVEKPTNVMVSVVSKIDGKTYKHMQGGSNYCADIYVEATGKKAGKWQLEVIKSFDANQPDFKPRWQSMQGTKRVMRLHIDDMVAYDEEGKQKICRVQKISTNGQIFFIPHNVSSPERIKLEVLSMMAGVAQKNKLRKISVSPDGVVFDPAKVDEVCSAA